VDLKTLIPGRLQELEQFGRSGTFLFSNLCVIYNCGIGDAVCPEFLHLVAAAKLRKCIRRGFFKTSQAAAKDKLHFVGWSIALLGD
jgi:hypothetical protein